MNKYSKVELFDLRDQMTKKMSEIIATGESEKRKLNDEESAEFAAAEKKIAEIESELEKRKSNNNQKQSIKMEKFSLLKAINDVANNRQMDEITAAVVAAGNNEMRKSQLQYSGQIQLPVEARGIVAAGTDGAGAEVVAEDKLGLLEPLRANLVLAAAGANIMTGLVGNVSIPTYSGSNVSWKGETGAATDGAGSFSEVNLEPKRLTAYLDISKQFLIQDSVAAEAMLRNDLAKAIANKLESTILGNGVGDTNTPAGMFNAITADTTNITYAGILAMENTLDEANVIGNRKFIVSPSAKLALKSTAKDTTGNKYLMEGNEVIGYEAHTTSAAVSKGILFGDFSDYVIAQWGALDITVDPFSQAANGCVRLVVNAYFDAKPRRATSFAKKILK